MNQRTKATASAATMILVLAIMFASVTATSTQAAASIPRNETVWGSGQGMTFTNDNPFAGSGSASWTAYLMYEPLFGQNVANNSMIYWLGKSIAWTTSTQLTVTLKSDIHWTSLDSANTLGVTNSTKITADDVIYSYELMEETGQIPGLLTQLVGGHVSTSFAKVNDTALTIDVVAAYANSVEAYRGIVNQLPIVPKAVWVDINSTLNGALTNVTQAKVNLAGFANNWVDTVTAFKAKWMVASGMYLPYFADAVACIAIRNANWWGASDSQFGRLPAPMYWGYTGFPNDAALLELQKGDLDWDGNYIAGLQTIKTTYPNILTYFPNLPYFPDKAVDEWSFNQAVVPLNMPAVHKAMLSVMNYTLAGTVSSGYLKTPNIMLIPADDAIAQANYNATLAASLTPAFDATGALGKHILRNAGFTYYANPGNALGLATAMPVWFTNATVGGKHLPLAEWNGATNASIKPYTVLNFNGWTDVDAIDVFAAASVTSALSLNLTVDQGPANTWDAVHARVNGGATGYAGGYDIFNMVMSGQLNMNMYERYYQQFSTKNAGTNAGGSIASPLGGYSNATLTALIDQLDNNTGTALQTIANKCQNIIGSDLPVIPVAGHADWAIYSNLYFRNWPNSVNNTIQASGPYEGVSQGAANLLVTFALVQVHPSGAAGTTGIDPMVVGLIIVVIVVVAAVAIVLVMRRKPSK